jgi:hypothetical protein
VLLTFNSGIELDLSRVWLVSAGDVHTPVAIAAGRKPGKLLVNLPALSRRVLAIGTALVFYKEPFF